MQATVYIHGGDYDCSELVRMCYRAVGVLPCGSYMWTGNEVALLKENGFVERSLSSPVIGDVLWRSGHTEIYLGGGKQGGARGSETGGITGRQGDQTGNEITKSAYRASDWTKLLRYEGGKKCEGIPCAIAAALVADHIIAHEAHGYSQPNRAGDGTMEAITICWDQGFNVAKLTKSMKVTIKAKVAPVRVGPEKSYKMVAKYVKGDTLTIEGMCLDNGYVWGVYTGQTSGEQRFVALGTSELVEA